MELKRNLKVEYLGLLLLNAFALCIAQGNIRTINWVVSIHYSNNVFVIYYNCYTQYNG